MSAPLKRRKRRGERDNDPHYVYEFWTERELPLYVGCTVDLPKRLGDHFRGQPWIHRVGRIEVNTHPCRREALRAELARIKELRPIYNRQGVDRADAA